MVRAVLQGKTDLVHKRNKWLYIVIEKDSEQSCRYGMVGREINRSSYILEKNYKILMN